MNDNTTNELNTNNKIKKHLYRNIVLLYCPSKVGSTTIASSTRISLSDKYFVFHTHDFVVANIISNGKVKQINVIDILRTAGTLNEKGETRNVYVIDIFRPQIERKISEYFQDLSEKHFNNIEENLSLFPLKKIIKRFNDICPHIESIDYYKDNYLIPMTKFNFEKKYLMHKNNNITFVKLRLIDSNEWSNILSEIFGEKIYMVKDYESKNKKIGEMYKNFLKEYQLPYNYFELEQNCPQLNFYYTTEEKENYLNKWKTKITASYVHFTEPEYKIYKKISNENRYLFKNLNNHYFDDGCICPNCSSKRNLFLNMLKTNQFNNSEKNIDDYKINHKYDENFLNEIMLIMKDHQTGKIFEHTVNVINY